MRPSDKQPMSDGVRQALARGALHLRNVQAVAEEWGTLRRRRICLLPRLPLGETSRDSDSS